MSSYKSDAINSQNCQEELAHKLYANTKNSSHENRNILKKQRKIKWKIALLIFKIKKMMDYVNYNTESTEFKKKVTKNFYLDLDAGQEIKTPK